MGIGTQRTSLEVSKKKQGSKEVCNLNQGNEEATCRNPAPKASEKVRDHSQGNEEAMHRNQALEEKARYTALVPTEEVHAEPNKVKELFNRGE